MKRLLALFLVGSVATVSFAQTFFSVKVNEILASGSEFTNALGHPYDRIELYNPTDVDISLDGASLGDNTALSKYIFASYATIPARGFFVVNLDPEPDATNSFHLNRSGDAVFFGINFGYLSPMAQIDVVPFGQQITDMSIGRVPDGTGAFALLSQRSFGTNNPAPATLGNQATLKINEWMAKLAGHDDYMEIYNPGTVPVDLGGMFIEHDSVDENPAVYQFPSLEFVGTGKDGFLLFYGKGVDDEGEHASFTLKKTDGLTLRLSDNVTQVDRVAWGLGTPIGEPEDDESQGRVPDGGDSISSFPKHPTPGAPNFGVITNIVVNELLTHTDLPLEDAVELYNPTDQPVDISGWFMGGIEWWKENPKGDEFIQKLKRYQFPANTIVPAHGYYVAYEVQFHNNPLDDNFTFNSAHGGSLFISQPDVNGEIQSYLERTYPPSANGVSFGRITNSDGDIDFVALECRSFGAKEPVKSVGQFRTGHGSNNACAPKWGPVIISEIMYHPPDIGTNNNVLDEFIELRNVTTKKLPLFDPRASTNGWKVRGGVSFTFTSKDFIDANGYVLLVNFDPVFNPTQLATFRTMYNVPANVPIRGPIGGKLENFDDIVELLRPDPPQNPVRHPDDAGFVPYILVDRVHYEPKGTWDTNAHGGLSFQRANTSSYGDEPYSWHAADPTAGRVNAKPLVITSQPQPQTVLTGQTAVFQVAVSGSDPQFQWLFKKKPAANGRGDTLSVTNVNRKNSGVNAYSVVITNFAGKVTSVPVSLNAIIPVKFSSPKQFAAPVHKPVGTKRYTFVSKATGTATKTEPLHYQWWFIPDALNNGPIALTNTAKLVLSNLTTNMSGQYYATVSNVLSSATSVTNTLTIP